MDIPRGATVAVADGERLNLFRNSGDEANPKLTASTVEDVTNDNKGSGARHQSSSANPDNSQIEEDSFAAGTADLLNRQVLGGQIDNLIIIAAPRTLGNCVSIIIRNYRPCLLAKSPRISRAIH